MATFSTRLQELKETKKLLQKDAAKALDVPLRTYQRYEHGEQALSIEGWIFLADLYDVSLDYLVGRSDDPTRYGASAPEKEGPALEHSGL